MIFGNTDSPASANPAPLEWEPGKTCPGKYGNVHPKKQGSSTVRGNHDIPANEIWVGVPAKFKKKIS